MKGAYKTLIISLTVNIFLMIIKLVIGVYIKSKALIADGIHSLTDFATDFIAIIGYKASTLKADENHPYGHGRMEYITSIIIGLIIMLIGITLIYNSFLTKTNIINYNVNIIGVVLLIILCKYGLSKYVLKKAKQYHSNILTASGKDSLTDVLISITVLITILLSKVPSISIFKYADQLGCIIVSICIINLAVDILKVNFIAILGAKEKDHLIINHLKDLIKTDNEVKQIDNFILIKYGTYYRASLWIKIDGYKTLLESSIITKNIETKLLESKYNIKYLSIHVNPF